MKSVIINQMETTGNSIEERKTLSESVESYHEATMDSRHVDIHHAVSFSNGDMALHSHNFHEILCCISASDVEYLVGADRYRLQKGDIIYITPGTSHRPLLPERLQAPYHRDVIRISPEFIANLHAFKTSETHLIPEQSFLLRTDGTRWEYLTDLFRWCVTEAEQKEPNWELVVISNVCQFLVHISRALQDRSAVPLHAEKPQLLDQVLDYIESHLGDKISLAEVSQQFYVSPSTITQTFRNKMGVSFYRCVTQRRLIAAKRLIEQGLSLDSISEQVGFKDYSSFYRAFKQEYGISPRQYRTLLVK